MKKNLHNAFLALTLILLPTFVLAQQAPNLGTTSGFAFFTAAGAFNVTGATTVTGNVGTHVGAFSGFGTPAGSPGTLIGTIHVADPATAAASADVLVAYGYVFGLTCDHALVTPIGTQTLTPGVYCIGSAAVLAGDLTLNGGGDPDAKFYFQIDGALATNDGTKIILENGTQWSNVYWQINGEFTGGGSSVFVGTILGGGVITLNAATLIGRGLTTAGAISLNAATGMLAPPLTVTTTQVDVDCFGSLTGSATAIPAGGVPAYSYSWNTIPEQTAATATGLAAGNYIVTVTDNLGFIATANVSIQQPLEELMVSTTQADVPCFGSSSASATALVQGGTAPYSYSWNTIPEQTTATANNLSSGNYIVTVTDDNGCIATANVSIQQPLEAFVVNTIKTDVLCFGDATGSATAIVQGGSAPFIYSWNTIPVQSTATINNLKAGTYIVTVTDNSGCIATANVIIDQPLEELMVNPIQTNVLCYGEATGSATAVPTGGTAPYTYLWNTIPAQTTATVNNLSAGNYTVRVTDDNGCIATANVTITEPGPITGSAMVAIVLTGLGGTGPLIYTLNGVSNNTGIFTNIDSGIEYTWSITDANNCDIVSGVIGLCLDPLALVVIDKVDVLCFNGNTGSIKVEASGGNAPYEYKLNNSPYQVSGTFNSLTAGAYTVTVRDAKGLTSSIPVTITQPSLLTVSTIQTDILCEGEATGSATALAQGGTTPYSYSWNTVPAQTTATAGNLSAGNYIVTVTDNNGCIATANATIDALNSLPAAAFTYSLSGLNTSTFVNASVNATSYAWDFGDGQAHNIANPVHVYVKEGTYTVKLTAANSCGTDIETQALTIPELEFFNGFSPNGDGVNDYWTIPVLNYYPVNTVLIINRWGSEVWKGVNYNNKDVVWTGKNMNGEDMPDGTYYYIINYDNTEKRGWVFIKR